MVLLSPPHLTLTPPPLPNSVDTLMDIHDLYSVVERLFQCI